MNGYDCKHRILGGVKMFKKLAMAISPQVICADHECPCGYYQVCTKVEGGQLVNVIE